MHDPGQLLGGEIKTRIELSLTSVQGMLLHEAHGTRKTLLARATAGKAKASRHFCHGFQIFNVQ
jgi:ATP-dependent 26S proteasome regulatory subunit